MANSISEVTNTITWSTKPYNELSRDELYNILHIRAHVFVIEQNCNYLDPDFKDQKALHIQGHSDGKLIAYCRLLPAGVYFEEAAIGRVLVDANYRRFGYGHNLMQYAIEQIETRWGENTIVISAQLYLKQFYESHGFQQMSDQYLEDQIPHIRMKRKV